MKNLIIIVYKINVNGQGRQYAEESMHQIRELKLRRLETC